MNKYKLILDEGKNRMDANKETQRPLSRAYLSLCPFNKALNKNAEEEASTATAYQLDHTTKKKKTKSD